MLIKVVLFDFIGKNEDFSNSQQPINATHSFLMNFRCSMTSTWRLIWSALMTTWRSTTGETPAHRAWDVSAAPKNPLRSFLVTTNCSCVSTRTTRCRREASRFHTAQVGRAAAAGRLLFLKCIKMTLSPKMGHLQPGVCFLLCF